MASGRPVIAYGQGGALETVVPLNRFEFRVASVESRASANPKPETRNSEPETPTGVFFYEPTSDSLVNALRLFEEHEGVFQTERLREHSLQFDRAIFRARIESFIQRTSKEWREIHPLTESPVASC